MRTISKIFLALSKENENGYLIDKSELPAHILELVKQDGEPEVSALGSSLQATPPKGEEEPEYKPILRVEADPLLWQEIEFNHLRDSARPQQFRVANAIYETLCNTEGIEENASLIVDIPFQYESVYEWSRCIIPLNKSDKIKIAPLQKGVAYGGQPLFPRLIQKNEITALDNGLRKKIYSRFLENQSIPKCPLHKMPKLMLRIAYTKPEINQTQIVNHCNKGRSIDGENYSWTFAAVEKNFKNLGNVGKNLFGVNYKFIRHLGPYWAEMGFNVEPIPELS